MALITVSDLNDYAADYASTLTEGTKQIIVDAAGSEVVKYLGYNPAKTERVDRFTGWGNAEQSLAIPAASAIESITIDETELAEADYELDTELNMVRLKGCRSFSRGAPCIIEYTAGWETMPNEIKMAALRIGALLLTEAQGNIGVTSKSFADMSRQFVNTTNFSKYLLPLSHLRRGTL